MRNYSLGRADVEAISKIHNYGNPLHRMTSYYWLRGQSRHLPQWYKMWNDPWVLRARGLWFTLLAPPKTPSCQSDVGNQAIIYRGSGQLVEVEDKTWNIFLFRLIMLVSIFRLRLRKGPLKSVGFKSSYTEHPRLFMTLVHESSAPFPGIKDMKAKDINMLNYINSKVVYSMRHTKGQVDNLFRSFESVPWDVVGV